MREDSIISAAIPDFPSCLTAASSASRRRVIPQLGDAYLEIPVEHEHSFTDTSDKRPPLVHRADDPPCGYEREPPSWFSGDNQEDFDSTSDLETQTVADVVERGNVVEYCDKCFSDLAEWTSDMED